MEKTFSISKKIVLFLSFVIGISSWHSNFEGGDIALARKSFRSSNPIDIWGGFSTFFYGSIPSGPIPWGAWLLIFQITFVTAGIIILSKNLIFKSKKSIIIYYFFIFIIISFSSYLTRDSTMTAFYILGLSLINLNTFISKKHRIFGIVGIILLILGTAFRPWLSFCAVLVLLPYLQKIQNKFIFYSTVLIMLTSPIALDQAAYLSKDIKKVHPEMQVMILDIASITCFTSNQDVTNDGIAILNSINNTRFSSEQLCGNFRPTSWQSIAEWNTEFMKSEQGKFKIDINSNKFRKIQIYENLNPANESKFSKDWIKFILFNPKDYVQIKAFQFTQLSLAGDSFGLRIFDSERRTSEIQIFKDIVFIPFDIAVSAHILSSLSTIIFSLIYLLNRKVQTTELSGYIRTSRALLSFIFLASWLFLSTIAYLGDNGRYTYLGNFIFCYKLLLESTKNPGKN